MKEMTEQQINNWRKVFPYLAFCSDNQIKQVVAAVEARLDSNLYNERFRREVANRTKSQFYSFIRVGSKFTENGVEKTVTRVTDIVFDCMFTDTEGETQVQIRNLGILKEAKTQNNISIVSL